MIILICNFNRHVSDIEFDRKHYGLLGHQYHEDDWIII